MRLLHTLVAAGLTAVTADLPIHCLNSDVAGRWEIELTHESHDQAESCGYHSPDQNELHFDGNSREKMTKEMEAKFKSTSTITLDLNQPNMVMKDGAMVGTWTMVYDEGFEITYNGGKYFAFAKYMPKEGTALTSYEVKEYTSYCQQTRIGWFKTATGYGCWRGKQAGGSVDLMELSHETSKSAHSHSKKIERLKRQAQPYGTAGPVVSLIDTSATDLLPFRPDLELIEAINNDPKSTWTAAVPKSFMGKSNGQIRQYLGRRKFSKPSMRLGLLHLDDGLLQEDATEHKAQSKQKCLDTDGSELPETFDWVSNNPEGKNYMSPVVDQGPCGSCYTVSSIAAYEARYRIAGLGDENLRFSPQDVLSCSEQNQGCEGGYPFLVAKFSEECGLIEADEMGYEASDSPKCSRDGKADVKKYYMKDHHYVGGYYGSCTEQAMMQELKANGPLVLGFEAPDTLSYYSGGIFKGPSPPNEPQTRGEQFVHKWEHTNHAVTLIGWGVMTDDGKGNIINEPYWLIQNTWGPDWGENGHFRIARGVDECAIESMAVAARVAGPE